MVIPDEAKNILLYHYPDAKFKVKYGHFYSDEIYYLSPKHFFYGSFKHDTSSLLRVVLLHSDGKFRSFDSRSLNPNFNYLVSSVDHDVHSHVLSGYLIEII